MTPQTSSSLRITRPSLAFLVWVGVAMALVIAMPGRAMAAVIVVNSPSDADDAVGCTLRDAITAANTNNVTGACAAGDSTGPDTITFNLSGPFPVTIILGSTLPTITDAQGLTIDGGSLVAISGNHAVRVFDVHAGASLTLESVTVQDGSITDNYGGGIGNAGTLFVTNSTLVGNSVNSTIGTSNGGGIVNGGTLVVTRSTLVDNHADGDFATGGAIYNIGGTATITHSTLSGNSATDSGGGIFINLGTVTVTNSTLSGNTTDGFGGGIANRSTLVVTNSTLVGNSAPIGGGGIANAAANQIDLPKTTITNSLVAVANGSSGANCVILGQGSFTAEGINLATDGSCLGFIQVDPPADLNLGPLADNGGPTPTHALLPGSVAINAGNQSLCAVEGITTDQRGFLRVGNCDIGAFEFGTIEDLIDDAASLLGSGTRSVAGLLAKLNAALASVASGNTGAACNKLGAFINQVNGNSSLTLAERQALLDAAVAIRAALGC